MLQKIKSSGKASVIIGGIWAVLLEVLEELLEEAIALGFSWVIGKAVSFVIVLTISQKFIIKKIIKIVTYKGGTDKMDKLKVIAKWIVANKKSLLGTFGNAVVAGGGIATSWAVDGLPEILVKGFNIAPIIYTVVCLIVFALTEIGVCGKGFECIAGYAERKAAEAKAKEEAKAKAEEEAKAKAEAEAAEALKAEAIAYNKEQEEKAKAAAEAREHQLKVLALAKQLKEAENK